MSPIQPANGLAARAAPQLVAESDPGMLDRIIAAVTSLVGARSAYVERITADPDVVEIVAAVGPDAPPEQATRIRAMRARPRAGTKRFIEVRTP